MKPLSEQTILVTGATDGLGRAVALELTRLGARVLLHGRSQSRLDATRQAITDAVPAARLDAFLADFASLDEVRALADAVLARYPRLDTLINNAGIGGYRNAPERQLSRDGHELRFAVNYLAPFLFTRLLLPALRHTPPSRIINVSSLGQRPIDFDDVMLEREYDSLDAYRQSKLAQIMFTIDLAAQVPADEVTVNALHPASLMPTKMVYQSFGYTQDSLEEGVTSVLRLAADPALDGVTGRYFDRQQEARAKRQAYDPDARRRLWALSEQLTGLS